MNIIELQFRFNTIMLWWFSAESSNTYFYQNNLLRRISMIVRRVVYRINFFSSVWVKGWCFSFALVETRFFTQSIENIWREILKSAIVMYRHMESYQRRIEGNCGQFPEEEGTLQKYWKLLRRTCHDDSTGIRYLICTYGVIMENGEMFSAAIENLTLHIRNWFKRRVNFSWISPVALAPLSSLFVRFAIVMSRLVFLLRTRLESVDVS